MNNLAFEITSLVNHLRLLIVEDDPIMQLGLKQVLSGYSGLNIVGIVEDGVEAVQIALKLKPDLILMDLGLPKLNGIEATKQIKAIAPQIAVVLLTGDTTQEQMLFALRSGAQAYCLKGTAIEQLLAAMIAAKDGGIYIDPQLAQSMLSYMPQPVKLLADVKLSQRELQVLKLIVQGKSNTKIASELYLSHHTVKSHVQNILNKLVVRDRIEAAVFAIKSGLVT